MYNEPIGDSDDDGLDGEFMLLEAGSLAEARALGAEIDAPTLTGSTKLKIPAGTQPGQTFRLKGKGFPHLRGSGIGDQLCRASPRVRNSCSSRTRSGGRSPIPRSTAWRWNVPAARPGRL